LIRRGGAPGLITYSPIRATGGTGDFPTTLVQVKPTQRPELTANIPQYTYTLSRPLSYTNPAELEKIVKYGYNSQEEPQEIQDILERLKSRETVEEKKIETKTTEQEEKIKEQTKEEDVTSKIQKPLEPEKRTFEPTKPQKTGQVPEEISLKNKEKSLYEMMLEQSEKTVRERKQQKIVKEANETKEEEQPQEEKRQSELTEIDKETAEALQGVHKTFATESKTKFNQYMKTAEDYLKKGQYYRAADAYTLASIYNPSDPFAYAGRSHALFASGEYMSSAYYLMRAINMYPDYATVRVDLNAMIPDKDKLESRISDVNKWIERSKSPELQFLLAYVYNQLGKTEQAKDMINAASEKLPDNEAVKTLKDVIENK
jgi:tetratricopeptide (TPR) repeat protein